MLAAPKPAPWKLSQNEIVLCRPVAARASLSAISIASEPEGASSTLPSPGGRERDQPLRQLDRRPVGEAARRERQLVELRLESGNQPRMTVAQMMDIIAVKIHVTAAAEILEP